LTQDVQDEFEAGRDLELLEGPEQIIRHYVSAQTKSVGEGSSAVQNAVWKTTSNMTLIGGRRKVFLQFRQRIPALHRNRET
jgi:hypothetical protein